MKQNNLPEIDVNFLGSEDLQMHQKMLCFVLRHKACSQLVH